MKKIFKIIGLTLLVILLLLIALPIAFQGKIKDMVKQTINDNLNAKVEFNDVSLSLLRSFPKAHVNVDDLVITNFEPFKDETFVTAKNMAVTFSIKELFKKADEGPIGIKTFTINEALVTLKTDKFGNANYDIAKETENNKETASTSTDESGFSISLEDYSINKSTITYIDEASHMTIHLTELNHSGHGIFSAETSELETLSEANISFTMDSTNYLTNNPIKLDAIIGLDLKENKYTFKENKALINQLPLEFHGFVKLLEDGQEVDITFENPGTTFKDFLALIPKTYSKDIADVKTTGSFKINGIVKGLVTDETIPTLDIDISSDNASFKYPDLPKRVENISIHTTIKNTTGHADDTYVNIDQLDFKIDEDIFKSSATIKNLTKNILVNANVDGTLNLANITKAYPVELENQLSGILKAKLNTAFDMNAIETNAYERIKNKGTAYISDFIFSSEDIVNPIHISGADLEFTPETIALNNFKAKTGDSDLDATGHIKNLLGFLLSDNTLQGHFNVNSNLFKVSDFMTEDEAVATNDNKTDTIATNEALKIPAFLDCTINANAKTVVYDNLNLKDVKGQLVIKDQQATLQNLTSSIFDGSLAISGNVSTKNDTPSFNINLGVNGLDISNSFKDLELLQNLAPIAGLIQGQINSDINLSGDLDEEFTPNLNTVSGNLLGELLSTSINTTNQTTLFNKLESALNFIDFDKLNLKDVKTKLDFANGKVSVKPFDLKYEDIDITVSGNHGFDKTLDYSAVFNVPAKYLGSEVNQLIGKIDDKETKNITIPVTATIGGSYLNPTVNTDLKSGITNLTKQLVDIQKQKLLNKGKSEVTNMLDDLIGGNKAKTDSLKTEQNNTVKDVLETIVGDNKTNTDTTKTNNTKETVKNVLGGILGKNKN